MARNFRRQRATQPIAELNVTNLIDLGFMLLIIFMVATSVSKPEQTMPINLPLESKSPQVKPDPNDKFESITIKPDGTFLLGTKPVTLGQLSRELAVFAAMPKPPVFRIRGDAKTPMLHLVAVMDELKKHKLVRVSVDTQTTD